MDGRHSSDDQAEHTQARSLIRDLTTGHITTEKELRIMAMNETSFNHKISYSKRPQGLLLQWKRSHPETIWDKNTNSHLVDDGIN